MAIGSAPHLSWPADASLFIDSQQVAAFYDAVVGPAFRTVQTEVSAGQTEQMERSAGGSLNEPKMTGTGQVVRATSISVSERLSGANYKSLTCSYGVSEGRVHQKANAS